MEKDHFYFPNLDGLRFIAAFMVLYDPVKYFKRLYGVNEIKFPFGTNFGHLGVTLFFVLSGFLITYLLLEEHRKFGRIQLRFFYMRRVLRIFPLYGLAQMYLLAKDLIMPNKFKAVIIQYSPWLVDRGVEGFTPTFFRTRFSPYFTRIGNKDTVVCPSYHSYLDEVPFRYYKLTGLL